MGCGDGYNTLEIARHGYLATGMDLSEEAITKAKKHHHPLLDFVKGNALYDLKQISIQPWGSVLDSGLFHALTNKEQFELVKVVHKVLKIGGIYNLLCFSELETRDPKPRCLDFDHINTVFAPYYYIKFYERVKLTTTIHEDGANAWLFSFTKKIVFG